MAQIEMLAVVALLEDAPEYGLVRGQVGTVVEELALGVYKVEFRGDDGRTYALVSLKADQLMRLHPQPIQETAYDLALQCGAIGCAKELPPDLSTNRKHMKGFGGQ